MRPLVGQAHGLTEEVRALTRESRQEVARIGEVTGQVQRAAEGLGRVASGLAGLARAGQLIGLAAGLRRGVDAFVHRMRREQGDDHGE